MKRLIAIILCLIMLFALTACSGGRHASDAESPVALRAATPLDEEDPLHLSMLAWAEAISEASEGSVQITVEPNVGADGLDLVRGGEYDMALVPFEAVRALHSEWSAISMPYVYDTRQQYFDVMDGEIGKDLYALLEADGLHGLTWTDNGARSFYTADTSVEKPGDLAGLRIAAVNDDAEALITALGGTAVHMEESDVPEALRSGAVDGAENFLAALEDQTDGVGYLSMDEHTRTPSILMISADAWNRLTPQQQEIVQNSCEELSGIRRAAWSDHEALIRSNAKKADVEIFTEVKVEAFRDACGSLYEQLQSTDPAAYAFVERILAAADD